MLSGCNHYYGMNDTNKLRALMALSSALLVAIFTLTVFARMDIIHGLGVQHINQTSSASTGESIREVERQLFNLTAKFLS
jgi:hypothetical protein